ncbi:hypothetical protein KN246_15825 [Mycobacterium intracellulare]|uniref:hypothetical protein n=1 Tax=Mycobacterium intracellulare TaxID=1767 RepID=UPI001E2E2E4C|nr:hypothetical protein [Mycobacterium intracellulare]UGT94858.1 hypothetical protein LTQ55_13745 [Mycobacterium intracellulare]UQB95734.1 hypothetical protein KN246_15825 [Mycobacterium intracellulare]
MSDGVKLASGYIELTVKQAGSAMKDITAEITGVGRAAEKVGQQAADALSKGVSKGAKDAGKAVSDEITKSATKAGEDAGKAAGDALNKGVTKASKDAGKTIQDEIGKAGKNTTITPKVDTKPARDSIIRDIGGGILEAARQGAKDAGVDLDKWAVEQAGKMGRSIGKAIGDSPIGNLARSIGVDGDQIISTVGGISDAITGIKNKDGVAVLGGISDALKGIGQNDAANTIQQVSDKLTPLADKYGKFKGDLGEVNSLFSVFEKDAPGIAGAWATIGEKALPVIGQYLALKEALPAIQHGLQNNIPAPPEDANDFGSRVQRGLSAPGPGHRGGSDWGWDLTHPWDIPGKANSWWPFKHDWNANHPPGQQPSPSNPPVAPSDGGNFLPNLAKSLPGAPSAAPSGNKQGSLNLSTIPVAVQKYANDCIDASARIILSHSGVNMTEDQLKGVITPGGSIESQAAGLNQLAPAGRFVPMQGSGGSPQVMFNAIKASIDSGAGSILNVAPGSSIAGRNFSEGHFIAVTGYNPDGTLNLSDTAGGTRYSVSAADAFQATRGRGIVAGTGAGPIPPVGYDDGGVLPPGMQLINNASGQPEIVLTQDQAKNAMQGMPGMGAGPSDTPPSSGVSPGPNGAAALTDLLGQKPDESPLGAVGVPGGKDQRTQGYIPAGAGGKGTAGTSLWSGSLQLGAQAINGLIEQAGSAAATAISAAATAGSFGAGGQAAGPASSFLIGIGTKMAERGVSYGFQMAGIAGDALAEILSPFGVPRLFQTDPSQFMPQLPGKPAAVTTGEKAQQHQDNPAAANDPNINPSGPVQPEQMPGQQVIGPSAPVATPGTGNYKPEAPPVGPGLSAGPAVPSLAPTQPVGPQAPQSGPMAQPNQPPAAPIPQKPPGPLDFVPLDVGSFDTGGWLMPNSVAINQTSRPEPILNPQQFDTLHAIASQGMPMPDPAAVGGRNDYSVRIENVTVSDVEAMRREIDSRQRLQMMRFAGRP